jgi:hypothetical protein
MANPTSNFGWQMPTPVDLVTDLPADFEVFGQAVDTSLADLKGGTSGQILAKNSNTDMDFVWVAQDDSNAIQNAIVDAKGDLIAATAADTPARLGVGTNGQVLTADSTAATGLTWATPAGGGGMTSIASGSLSGSSVVLSSISSSYTDLRLVLRNMFQSNVSNFKLTVNSVTSYDWMQLVSGATTGTTLQYETALSQPNVNTSYNSPSTSSTNSMLVADFPDYKNTSAHKLMNTQFAYTTTGGVKETTTTWSVANTTAAISSISLTLVAGTFSGGTYELFGVK